MAVERIRHSIPALDLARRLRMVRHTEGGLEAEGEAEI